MFDLPWCVYLLQFVAGLFLANGVPHFVQGITGHWFQSPFASPPSVGESSAIVNVLWGFLNLVIGFWLLFAFAPKGAEVIVEWAFVALGALLMALFCARHFCRVRSGRGYGPFYARLQGSYLHGVRVVVESEASYAPLRLGQDKDVSPPGPRP
jgi:hypothetical protein